MKKIYKLVSEDLYTETMDRLAKYQKVIGIFSTVSYINVYDKNNKKIGYSKHSIDKLAQDLITETIYFYVRKDLLWSIL